MEMNNACFHQEAWAAMWYTHHHIHDNIKISLEFETGYKQVHVDVYVIVIP